MYATRGLGARLTGKLLRQFGSPEGVFSASLTELEACRLPAATAQAVASRASFRDAEKELAEVRRIGCGLLHWQETEYPQRLLEIYDPPPLLYVRGDPQVLRRHAIAIVGTRRPTPYGNQIAERLARDLAERGLVIVSGLARGMDSSAHRGACAASARLHGGRAGMRDRRGLSEGEPEVVCRSRDSAARSSASFRWARIPRRTIFRCATASSPGWRWEWSWCRARNIPAR